MVGRALFLSFGCIALFFGVGLSFGDEPQEMQQAPVFALTGIGLMVGGAACGAAERRHVPPAQHYPLPGHHGQAQPPLPQAYDPQAYNAQTQQAYNPQGYTTPYPPG
ncbi:hypothetical protein [Planomonospora sp. ID82291]|uniref:hypothetical protein n=1 Tax=Planomonospora sp. ID82291 TaxID=2738136 RepID=UPI0018C38A0F|nr:hypothetical protein [Planomonospora sp. ID82291]MBG0817094.1 hypothetical protein [Planomonospora sp. ID82291]